MFVYQFYLVSIGFMWMYKHVYMFLLNLTHFSSNLTLYSIALYVCVFFSFPAIWPGSAFVCAANVWIPLVFLQSRFSTRFNYILQHECMTNRSISLSIADAIALIISQSYINRLSTSVQNIIFILFARAWHASNWFLFVA